MIEISKAVIEKDGKYLLLKRVPYAKTYPNKWDFAGGKHDPGETAEQVVIRETKEETNFSIVPGPKIKSIIFERKGKDNFLIHFFIPESVSGELELSHEHSEYKWMSWGEIKFLELHPAVREYFNL